MVLAIECVVCHAIMCQLTANGCPSQNLQNNSIMPQNAALHDSLTLSRSTEEYENHARALQLVQMKKQRLGLADLME